MIEVTLTSYEIAMAANVACLRNITANQRYVQATKKKGEWQSHIEGACGEVAVAKAMGKYWGGSINTFKKGGDIDSTGWEVRTRSEEHWDLIVRDDDPDGRKFILVTGISPTYRIWGWLESREAKRPEWRKNYGGHGMAYFVPKKYLRGMETINEY